MIRILSRDDRGRLALYRPDGTVAGMEKPTRDRILDAVQEILVRDGHSAVTLDAVAAAAGVSKGGLLYHFGSKSALITGLAVRLSEAAEQEFARARREGVVRTYLRTSSPESAEEADLYGAMLEAGLGGRGELSSEAEVLTHTVFERWWAMLREDVADPVLAEGIRLIGDGLFFTAISGLPQPDPALVRALIERCVVAAEQARTAEE